MKYTNIAFIFLVLAVILASISCGEKQQDQEWDVTAAEVPQAVLNTFNHMYPGAEVTGYAKEIEDGETLYEVSCLFKGRKVDAVFKPDGKVKVIEEVIAEEQLPEAVRQTISDEFPQYTIKLAEMMEKKEGRFFEVKLSNSEETRHYEVVLSTTGEVIEKEEINKIEE